MTSKEIDIKEIDTAYAEFVEFINRDGAFKRDVNYEDFSFAYQNERRYQTEHSKTIDHLMSWYHFVIPDFHSISHFIVAHRVARVWTFFLRLEHEASLRKVNLKQVIGAITILKDIIKPRQ